MSTQKEVGNLVADLVLDKIDLMEFGLNHIQVGCTKFNQHAIANRKIDSFLGEYKN